MAHVVLGHPRATDLVTEAPKDDLRALDAGFSSRTHFLVGVIVLMALFLGVFVGISFFFW